MVMVIEEDAGDQDDLHLISQVFQPMVKKTLHHKITMAEKVVDRGHGIFLLRFFLI